MGQQASPSPPPQTKEEFVTAFKHRLAGIVCDAATSGRSGADLAMFLRNAMKLIDAELGQAFDWYIKPEAPKTAQAVRK